MKALVSVIIPIYNVEDYLVRCVDSVLNQTYTNLEIILVDDGSPDNCPQICDQYAKADTRIKVIHKKNGGLSSARNAGLEIAAGDYVAFLDSDDYIQETMYEKLVTAIEANAADMVICGMRYVNEDGSPFLNVVACPIQDEVLNKEQAFSKLSELAYFYYVTTVNKLYKREIFTSIRFPVGKIHEDEWTIHYIIDKCDKIACVKEELYCYVQRSQSIMHGNYTIKRLDGAWACYDRYLFFKKRGDKKFAHNALRGAYGVLVGCVQHLGVWQYRKVYKKIKRKIIVGLKTDLRIVKLQLIYYKKLVKEIVRKLQYNLITLPVIRKKFKKARKNKKNVAVIMATPIHGNLGDQAIVFAEKQMLSDLGYKKNNVVEIPNPAYLKDNDTLKKYIKLSDWLIIDGGGNLGSLWVWEDDKISQIISDYPNNKITIFPQTIYYGNTAETRNRLIRNREIYERHDNLNIFFREKQSYQFFKENFPKTKAYYSPDIVLYSTQSQIKTKRTGILLCLRKDIEKVLDDNSIDRIEAFLKTASKSFAYTSTVIDKRVSVRNRKKELCKKWKEFASAELVITDRLHGMIFAAITGTPCIAFDNRSKKVSGVYDWIKEWSYIKCVNTVEELETAYFEVLEQKDYCLNLEKEFDQMKKDLLNG